MAKSNKVWVYTSASIGPTEAFKPMVTLKGIEEVEKKDTKRLHDLMSEIKLECLKLKVNFEARIYSTGDNSGLMWGELISKIKQL